MITGLVVLKIVLMPSSARRAIFANSGPRWSMIGVSMARRMRSGTGVGPGICRKWRPAVREEFFDIGVLSGAEMDLQRPNVSVTKIAAARLWYATNVPNETLSQE